MKHDNKWKYFVNLLFQHWRSAFNTLIVLYPQPRMHVYQITDCAAWPQEQCASLSNFDCVHARMLFYSRTIKPSNAHFPFISHQLCFYNIEEEQLFSVLAQYDVRYILVHILFLGLNYGDLSTVSAQNMFVNHMNYCDIFMILIVSFVAC